MSDNNAPLKNAHDYAAYMIRKGWHWNSPGDALDKVQEELDEVKDALAEGNHDHLEDEIGDLFMTIFTFCHNANIDPEQALARVTHKIRTRFDKMTALLETDGHDCATMDKALRYSYWQRVKKEEKPEIFP